MESGTPAPRRHSRILRAGDPVSHAFFFSASSGSLPSKKKTVPLRSWLRPTSLPFGVWAGGRWASVPPPFKAGGSTATRCRVQGDF